ncbi:MAG TPA: hypothetical protein VFS21_37115, partial [Roseiflexaceae bacterium]|nr:hypothetical protein [Roseiflexaceae bacterium]
GGATGADEIARRGEEERVQISAFGYGGGLGRGGGALAQVADRTGGVFLASPGATDLDGAVETLRQRASGGAYRLSYRTALPPDGAAHPLAVSVGAAGQQLSAQTEMLIPQPWDTDRTAALAMELDGSAYPDLSIIARPTNGLRRTVEQLSARDFTLTIDGSPLPAPPSIERVPLDPLDPAAAQTVALVVDQGGPNAATLRGLAAPLLQAPAEVPSRVALFVPGVNLGAVRFTHDHNAVLNALNGAAGRAAPGVGSGPTLLSAIHEAARDADAARRPAYLIWFADSAVPLDQRFNALVQARNKAVALHIVTVGPADTWLEPLARIGGGRLLVSPDAGALRGLADLIAADRATQYRLGFRAPTPGDGRRQTIALSVGDQQASAPLVAFVPGTSAARMPLSPPAQAGVFGLLFLALMAAAVLPRRLGDWRLRCPSCERVRRAEWGDSCLFCAQQPRSEAAPAAVPLEGFALQGAALIQEGQTPLRIEAAVPAEPPLLEREAGQALEAPPLTTLEQARAQSHTDFWGPLPGESAPPPRPVASPAPAPLAPPPLPIFEPAEPEQQPPAAELAEPEPGYEHAHSDFWGAPAEPDEPATDLEQPAGHTDFWGAPADSQTGQSANVAFQNTSGFWGLLDEPDEPPPGKATSDQASDFWGAEETGQTDDDTGVALPSSHTDFWGTPADKEAEGERRP